MANIVSGRAYSAPLDSVLQDFPVRGGTVYAVLMEPPMYMSHPVYYEPTMDLCVKEIRARIIIPVPSVTSKL